MSLGHALVITLYFVTFFTIWHISHGFGLYFYLIYFVTTGQLDRNSGTLPDFNLSPAILDNTIMEDQQHPSAWLRPDTHRNTFEAAATPGILPPEDISEMLFSSFDGNSGHMNPGYYPGTGRASMGYRQHGKSF